MNLITSVIEYEGSRKVRENKCSRYNFFISSFNAIFFDLSGWFWGDPHFNTLDGGNYTFNGLGEYMMIDAQNGTFQLQARTGVAQGNSTIATIFTAGAAKEENTSTIEVRVKKGGESLMMLGVQLKKSRTLNCGFFCRPHVLAKIFIAF